MSAKPTALPTKGAEQGVARRVANAPVRKDSASGPVARAPPGIASGAGSLIVAQSNGLAANSVASRAKPARNQGSWNLVRQPMLAHDAFRAISTKAMTRNDTSMPAEVARRPVRTARRSAPAYRVSADAFGESTGRTQGIRLRTRPSASAATTIAARSRMVRSVG